MLPQPLRRTRSRQPDRSAYSETDARNAKPGLFSDDVGIHLGTPIVEAIGCKHESKFTDRIRRITIEVK